MQDVITRDQSSGDDIRNKDCRRRNLQGPLRNQVPSTKEQSPEIPVRDTERGFPDFAACIDFDHENQVSAGSEASVLCYFGKKLNSNTCSTARIFYEIDDFLSMLFVPGVADHNNIQVDEYEIIEVSALTLKIKLHFNKPEEINSSDSLKLTFNLDAIGAKLETKIFSIQLVKLDLNE